MIHRQQSEQNETPSIARPRVLINSVCKVWSKIDGQSDGMTSSGFALPGRSVLVLREPLSLLGCAAHVTRLATVCPVLVAYRVVDNREHGENP